jgi:hypothetical protein
VNHREEILTFLYEPDIEATNWPAEQAVRPLVVNRKPIFDSNPGYPPPESLILGQKRGIPLGGQRNVVP